MLPQLLNSLIPVAQTTSLSKVPRMWVEEKEERRGGKEKKCRKKAKEAHGVEEKIKLYLPS
jgi:hypothetical protein